MINLGDNEINVYFNDEPLNIYCGEELLYPTGPFVGIKITGNKEFNKNNSSSTIRIQSSEQWELLKDANATWLSLSTTTGDTGKTTITIEVSDIQATTGETRTTTLTAMTTDSAYSATCVVKQEAMPYNQIRYRTYNHQSAPIYSSTRFYDAAGNILTYTNTYDATNNMGTIEFNNDVAYWTGHIWYVSASPSTNPNPITEAYFPASIDNTLLTESNVDIFLWGNPYFKKFGGDYAGIVDDGKVFLCDANYSVCAKVANVVSEVHIPEGVTTLKDYANEYCLASKIYYPSTLTKLNNYIWENSTVKALYFNGNNPPALGSSNSFLNAPSNVWVHNPADNYAYDSGYDALISPYYRFASHMSSWRCINDIFTQPVVIADFSGNTNNQGFKGAGTDYFFFDSGITYIDDTRYDFTGIKTIGSRDDAMYFNFGVAPVAWFGNVEQQKGALKTIKSINISIPDCVSLCYIAGTDSTTSVSPTLTSITFTDTDNVTTIGHWGYNPYIKKLSVGNLSNVTTVYEYLFNSYNTGLTDFSVDALPDMDMAADTWGWNYLTSLTRQSLLNILNALPTTSTSGRYITLGETLKNKLSAADIAIATDKGWEVR